MIKKIFCFNILVTTVFHFKDDSKTRQIFHHEKRMDEADSWRRSTIEPLDRFVNKIEKQRRRISVGFGCRFNPATLGLWVILQFVILVQFVRNKVDDFQIMTLQENSASKTKMKKIKGTNNLRTDEWPPELDHSPP